LALAFCFDLALASTLAVLSNVDAGEHNEKHGDCQQERNRPQKLLAVGGTDTCKGVIHLYFGDTGRQRRPTITAAAGIPESNGTNTLIISVCGQRFMPHILQFRQRLPKMALISTAFLAVRAPLRHHRCDRWQPLYPPPPACTAGCRPGIQPGIFAGLRGLK
jgi:hypothetical protein